MIPAPRLLVALAGFGLLAPAVSAYAPHPSLLTVRYKDKACPVVSYFIEECVALVDGKEKSIWRPGAYALNDAAGYGDNYVESAGQQFGGPVTIQKLGGPHLTQMPDTLTLNTVLTARKTIKGGFTVVGIYSPAQFSGPPKADNSPQLIIESLPQLPAGQPVAVEIELGAVNPPKDPHYFVLIFDGTGREVLTSGSKYAWEYFALCDRARLNVAIGKYLERFKGTDHDAVPAIMPKPVFDLDSVPPKGEVTAILTVTDSGMVSDVEIQGSPDSEVTRNLTAALEGWLFLPKLKAGRPVPVRIALPLKF